MIVVWNENNHFLYPTVILNNSRIFDIVETSLTKYRLGEMQVEHLDV